MLNIGDLVRVFEDPNRYSISGYAEIGVITDVRDNPYADPQDGADAKEISVLVCGKIVTCLLAGEVELLNATQ